MRSAGLSSEPVRRFMNPNPITVPPGLDLRQWVEDFVYRYHRKAFPVVSEGRLHGLIETQSLGQVPREEWDRHTVGEVMNHDLQTLTISSEADALEALKRMQQNGSTRLLVTEGDRLVGILSLDDLLGLLAEEFALIGRLLEREAPRAAALRGDTARA